MTFPLSDEKGFTLVEVLVALTIFAIGMVALAGMQITGIQGNASAQSITAKTALADGVIEEFLAMSGEDARLASNVDDMVWDLAPDVADDSNVTIDGAGTCSATVDVVVDPGGLTGLSQIEVSVTGGGSSPVVKTVMKRRY